MNTKKHPIPEYINLNKLGKPTLVHVRRSQRAKRISIRIKHEKVELIIPNSNFQKAQAFLLNKESWIRRKLESRQKIIIYNPDSLMIFGIEYPIKYVDNMEKKVKLSNSTIIVCSTIENRIKALREFLIDLLLLKIKEIMSSIRSQKNLRFTEIKISNNKSIWGSCSKKGVLSFSWRLIFVPLEALYYVIVHEMCHLLEMNHSPRFWGLVSDLCPDYRTHKLWLKKNAYSLYNYSSNLI
jgi:predicted metal-dependent hydrolase